MIMRVYFNKITTVHFSNPITFSRLHLQLGAAAVVWRPTVSDWLNFYQ